MDVYSRFLRRTSPSGLILVCLLVAVTKTVAQSGDPNFPTPVHNSSLAGKIAARDLGDARLTNHYYAFKATPGDLLITVNSRNLNGDMDLFTAGTLRPLLKITLYAESTAPVTKGVYLRRSEDLVLRIEARSPNDDQGTYQLFFWGSFQPIYGQDAAETPAPEISTTPSTGRRVSSVGARIEEPAPPVTEVAAAPTPEPTPEAKPVESPSPVTIEKPEETEAPKVSPPRTTRSRRPTGRRTPTPTTKRTEEAKTVEPAAPAETETKTETETPPARATNKRATTTARATKPPPEPEPESGPRLIIETNDGTLINRSMRYVRRVTVENGQVVVLNRDGTINRILLANVVKMAIQP